jgi:hypothetical protein
MAGAGRRKQLLDDLKETIKLKEETLDRAVRKIGFGRGLGPVGAETSGDSTCRRTSRYRVCVIQSVCFRQCKECLRIEIAECVCVNKTGRVSCRCRVYSFDVELVVLIFSRFSVST